jgi:hypothetical protein
MKSFRRPSRVALTGILAYLAFAPRCEAGVLYSQPPTVQSGSYETWTSAYTDSFLNYYQTLDNFQISSAATIGSISWQGMYVNYDPTTGYSNGSPNTNNWDIALYTGGGPPDFPFSLYASESIPASAVTETFAGTTNFEGVTVDYYNVSVALPTEISIQGGQTYYFSIFSDNGGSTDSWSWLSGSGGDDTSWQYSTYSDATVMRSDDRTFTLYSSAIPEPSSFLLGMLGVACSTSAGIGRRMGKGSRSL